MTRFALNPAMPVLSRPDGVVQVGWDPRRAVVVRPPNGVSVTTLAAVLRALQSGATIAQLQDVDDGIDEKTATGLVAELVDAGVVTAVPRTRVRSASIRIHGRGPLSDLLAGALRCSGARITHSSQPHAGVNPEKTDLVVLSDSLVADPRIVRDLHATATPHLPVRVRDGAGLVGPLVVPGVTSCLRCADLHRSDRDEGWPAVAAQLRDTVGTADRATVLATAAVALNQVDRVIAAVRGGVGVERAPHPPSTLDTTLEFDVNTGSTTARRWTRHPRCPMCTR
ncbi:TOMM precursor leader peptide-binding protein [Mycolicibacterium sp. 120270]|uniref:TOMM precursor leader peptide-binding protein n=1 Tax=Mycolicibacterium sp. 120270 TaxID=3090600 RepID=UPI00299DD377|nr:TOMM precursor leader peptide-binding protein [Mycolicibacterium sp. 120270]MDX1884004.1 TOMM precursor leader peptide-binding protein [Mycolicibacterium sp. 120270]